MSEVRWIKIVTDLFDDEKILLIETLPKADSIIVIWFKLLCLAGKQNNNGMLLINNKIPYDYKMLSSVFKRKESLVKQALETFEKYGMIELIDEVITIPNWEKHQNIDSLSKIREQTKKRVQKHREKQKENITCNVTSNVTVTQSNATDKEEDKEKNKNIKEIIRVYEEEIGHATSFSVTILESYLEDLPEDMIIKAIQIASGNNKKSLNYIEGILKSWIAKGYKVVADTENEKCKNNINDTEKRVMEALYGS